ncbi:DNA-(apurinic or apyrimidinic site) lyase-like [Scleropages formosus]|uniref:exodeoxyribonuclease III n=1 Tax=Scleropages formosus TaxID=113540 RepID=A0A0N8JYW7_SCLFO|nr:DNA-(apurinic or apyrimidinic site) lyase [Scleropages formosus]XP_018610453.1 DNA-(apurinic or apyrimidinic site) lyase [Scleropages formosus]KPP67689.1 DNA-(apurinic or apyrimidinic site) lyase-like [Scleropages formosus]
MSKRGKKKDTGDGEQDNSAAPPAKKGKKEKEPEAPILYEDPPDKLSTKDGRTANMKITSWNVDGLRAWVKKKGLDWVREELPDVICLQETKCAEKSLPQDITSMPEFPHKYWAGSEGKEGYSGVAMLCKTKPLNITYGIGKEEHDKEGRVITAEFPSFFLVTAYVPNAGRGLVRLDYRKTWDVDFRAYLSELDQKKPLVLCGDLNVAHHEIDIKNPKGNRKNAGFTAEEREGFTQLLAAGFVDSFRELYPEQANAYTFWTYMMNARAKNVGWRLDYFVISRRLLPSLCDSKIRNKVMGSDHCPITLHITV